MLEKINYFLSDAKREFKRINWPTTKDTYRLTLVVIVISLLFAVFLGAFDFLFLIGLEQFL